MFSNNNLLFIVNGRWLQITQQNMIQFKYSSITQYITIMIRPRGKKQTPSSIIYDKTGASGVSIGCDRM